ncbi:MAG: hypothetical protein NXI01_08730 [Gammaproteobacteria bacterium]|nr:hypothetical protein [Gammaproteobacteria bacterium]
MSVKHNEKNVSTRRSCPKAVQDEQPEILLPYIAPALIVSPMKEAIRSGPQEMDESNSGVLS